MPALIPPTMVGLSGPVCFPAGAQQDTDADGVIVKIKGLKFQLLLPATCPWANHTTILSLHFCTDKLETLFPSLGCCETIVRVT